MCFKDRIPEQVKVAFNSTDNGHQLAFQQELMGGNTWNLHVPDLAAELIITVIFHCPTEAKNISFGFRSIS